MPQFADVRRQHDVAILAPFALLDTDDLERSVDMFELELDDLADAQAGAVADRKQHACVQVVGHGQQPCRLLRAQDLRDTRRLLDVMNLIGEIEPAHGDTEQKLEAGHRPVARQDRGAGLHEMQLEQAHLVDGGGVGRALEPGGKPLAGADMTDLRAFGKLPRRHILQHALAKR